SRPEWTMDYARGRLADERRRLDQLRFADLDVRASFMLSYRELSDEQALLFRRLGIVPGPSFGVDLACAVGAGVLIGPGSTLLRGLTLPKGIDSPLAPGDDDLRYEVEKLLEDLRDAQLLEPANTPGRYRFHDLLLLFARDLLSRADEASEILVRLMFWAGFVAACTRVWTDRLDLPDQATTVEQRASGFASRQEAFEWFENEREHLVAAVRLAAEFRMDDQAVLLAKALAVLFRLRGYWDDWLATCTTAIADARRREDHETEAVLLETLGTCLQDRMRHADAVPHLERSVQLADQFGTWHLQVKARASLAQCHLELGRGDEAERLLSVAEKLLAKNAGPDDNWLLLAYITSARAIYDEHIGRIGDAQRGHERVLELCRRARDPLGQVTCMNRLGRIHLRLGRPKRAVEYLEASRKLGKGLSGFFTDTDAVHNLAFAYHLLGDHQQALELFEQAASAYHRYRLPALEAQTLHERGGVFAVLRRWDDAAHCWRRADELLRDVTTSQAEDLRTRFERERSSWRTCVPWVVSRGDACSL
ncbi:tetratricopeptide repeat protein, partial [Candidatus Protofrankia californiensis]|uniref:tetratricopeptide repeat protein n=1 Tax=Candidatus Protofrankia californiensis TaxID=1839754 RepID=UPI0019CFBFFC